MEKAAVLRSLHRSMCLRSIVSSSSTVIHRYHRHPPSPPSTTVRDPCIPQLPSTTMTTVNHFPLYPSPLLPYSPKRLPSGAEDKSFVKATSVDNDTSNLCVSPNLPCQTHLDGRDFNSENLELSPISTLSSSISELLQTYAPGSVGSSFARSTVINKLLVWMGNISKELEVTESEIEALEIELKSLITETGKSCPCPAASSSLLGECVAKPCEELVAATNIIPRPSSLLLDSSGDMIVERADGGLVDKRGQAGDEDVDSPGTATSKFVGLLSSTKGAAMSDPVICGDVNSSKLGNFEMKCSLRGSNEETTCCASSSEVGYQLIASKSSAPQVGMSSQCYSDDMLYDQIVASNKGSASRASEVLDKLLPSRTRSFCSWASNAMIQEKFVKRKRFLKFRERVITLLFRAMQHLWKEDMRLLSIKKNQAKSQKRSELILCTQNGSYQKHRSSICSRFASPGSSAWVRGFCSESTDPRIREIFETKHLEFLEKIYERQTGNEINEVSMKKYLDIFLKLCRLEFPHFLRWIEDVGLRVSTGSHLENRKPVGRIAWLRPPIGFVKVNVDGSYIEGQEGCNGGGGIAIRDCYGAVKRVFSVSFQGIKNSYHAELEALHLASFLSIRFSHKNVIFESDRLEMIRAIKSGEDIPNDFFEEFLALPFHLLDDYEASYIPREGNIVADILANGAGKKNLWNKRAKVLKLALEQSRRDLQRLPYYRIDN
ncbi:hypothetical protein RHGRI_021861 [Rhododendron griersonianum]|uniref:RNase H type-1 domain-containing protein n=1 Tax=Rhododendron griersonianum TaxID=479676 RepID=A0AAV6JLQ4_9ERIC|nr:hypothetical protein RHGRI_021861 [Rhododendron griersonianum]